MKETIDLLGKIITNILTALYEPFGFSLLLSFLAMFFYLYAYEPSAAGKGWKSAIVTWYQKFKESVFFRRLFFLAFVTSLILFRTLLNRQLWMNPLSDVMGGWGIWETVNGEQKLTTECIENVIMMVPFSVIFSEDDLLYAYDYGVVDKKMFPTIDDLRKAITAFQVDGECVSIQKDEINYPISPSVLQEINAEYNGRNLLDVVGNMIHQYPEQRRYREQRCIDIYGKLI